jgi:DNA-binding transcriptional LysR family regulator
MSVDSGAKISGVVAFMTVVAEGNFSKAGDRLGIGRSAVSRGVQKLESQLGGRLLSRTTRSLALTLICYQSRQHLPSRIRVFVDHMTAAIRALELQCAGEVFDARP